MSRRPVVARGFVCCPDCGGRLCGYVDVTVNPMLRANGTMGPLVDNMADIREQACGDFASALEDEFYCVCGYRIAPRDLRDFLKTTGAPS